MARLKTSTVIGVLALAGAAGIGMWLLGAPDPALKIPPLHPPHVVRAPAAAHPNANGAPEDEPVADDPPPTSNAHDGPSRADLEAALARVKPHLAHCQSIERFVGPMTVKMLIARSGNVQSVIVLQPPEKTQTVDCVVKAIKAGSFPRFRGEVNPVIEWTYPLQFREGGLL